MGVVAMTPEQRAAWEEAERAGFKKHLRSVFPNNPNIVRRSRIRYLDYEAEARWETWLARASQPVTGYDELAETVAKRLLPCKCGYDLVDDKAALVGEHTGLCPAQYRPAVAAVITAKDAAIACLGEGRVEAIRARNAKRTVDDIVNELCGKWLRTAHLGGEEIALLVFAVDYLMAQRDAARRAKNAVHDAYQECIKDFVAHADDSQNRAFAAADVILKATMALYPLEPAQEALEAALEALRILRGQEAQP